MQVAHPGQTSPLQRQDETVGDLDDGLPGQTRLPWAGDEAPVSPTAMTSPIRSATWSGVPTNWIDLSTRSATSCRKIFPLPIAQTCPASPARHVS